MKKLLFLLMALSLVFALALPCFANYEDYSVGNPFIQDEFYLGEYLVLTSNGTLYDFSYKHYVTSGGMVTFNLPSSHGEEDVAYVDCFYNVDTGLWEECCIVTNSIQLPLNDIVWSSIDLVQGEKVVLAHDPYFWSEPLTLEQTVQNAWTDTINNDTIPYLSSAILALVVAGVGIIAMFVFLKLIGKRTLINR